MGDGVYIVVVVVSLSQEFGRLKFMAYLSCLGQCNIEMAMPLPLLLPRNGCNNSLLKSASRAGTV